MFKEIFTYELKLWLKRPGIYIYFAIFIALAFFMGAIVSGMFGGVSNDTNSYINSATSIASILTEFSSNYLFGLVTMLICVALMAGTVQKDFQYNSFAFYFTKPISKFSYLIGRFSASLLLTILVLTGVMLGLFIAFSLSPNDNGQLGPFGFLNFFQPFIYFLIPNAFLVGSLFFCVVTFSRNMISGYVGSLVFIVAAGIARSMVSDIDNKLVAALVDPFGTEALDTVIEYWTPAEGNTRLVPFSGYIAYNRLLWLGVSVALLLVTYYRFSFNQFLNPVSLFKPKTKESTSQPSRIIQSIGHLPKVKQQFGIKFSWQQLLFLTRFEFLKMVRSVFFMIVVGLSVLLTAVASHFSGLMYGTELYPVTYLQIEQSGGTFNFFQVVMIVFYCGVLIWRERDSKVDELVGSTPVKNAVFFGAKFFSLLLLCLTVNLICILTCICLQTASGYTNYELGLYFTDLILMRIIGISLLVALGLSIQVFFRNRYFGFFAMALVVLGIPLILKAYKYSNDLLIYNSSGGLMKYSDMNGHGHTLPNYFIYKGYWVGFALLFVTLAVAMYQRGREQLFLQRFRSSLQQLNGRYKASLVLGLVSFLGCGFVVYYNRSVINTYKSPKQEEQEMACFEKDYKKYARELQPRVVASNVNVDIFPDELGCRMNGFYVLRNKNNAAVSRIFVNYSDEAKMSLLRLDVQATKFLNDTARGFIGYRLSQPLQPGDSLKLEFDLSYFPKNFILRKEQTLVVQNGSFFNSALLPSIGYNPDVEISDNSARKKYGLAPKPRMADIRDTSAYKNTYISSDADWIRFECVVSTKEGQTAIAPGYLQKDWKENGRHYFHYKMDAPILNFYAFLSAEYEVEKEQWVNPLNRSNVVNIEIYYHQGHEYNLKRMIGGIKKSLDYFTRNFSPYQHRQVRIIEFPRYELFAQSFPNTIPFSEGIGFIARVDDADPAEVDYPFYVTAHEVAHQWWAHQAIGANVQGSTLMSETMAQYSALMVMEKEYGQAAMSKFLRYEMDDYLQGRASEGKKEVPLMLVENQMYIHYNKGSMVLYALKDYLGEDTLNTALSRYIKKVGYQEPPYTTALEFYDFIKRATPDSLKETVKDLFERIVVFDNSVKNWSYTKTADGKFKVVAVIKSVKTRSDSLGKASEVAPDDWIDLGIFEKNGKNIQSLGNVIYMKKVRVKAKEQSFEWVVDKEPFVLGIDPYNKLIDKETGNNLQDVNGKNVGHGSSGGSTVVVSAEE